MAMALASLADVRVATIVDTGTSSARNLTTGMNFVVGASGAGVRVVWE
jgi:hypothetical protein